MPLREEGPGILADRQGNAYINWVAALLSYIYDQYGEDAAVHALRETVGGGQAGWGIQGGLQRKQLMELMGREEGFTEMTDH
jgi:hypothetical protein